MTRHRKNHWWRIFEDNHQRKEETCPIVPVNSGQDWQKELAVLYCPCKSNPDPNECRLPLI